MVTVRSIIASFLLAALATCEWTDTRQASYADYKAAENAGEVARGWIPAYIPKSAVDIRIKYDIENNQTWLTFYTTSDDLSWIATSCKRVSHSEINYPRKSPARWWPSDLVDKDQKRTAAYEFYRCHNKGVMAINKNKKEFFYWYLGS